MLIPFETLQKRYKVYPKGILHVGANVGEEAEAYNKAGIKNVIWIEANPEIYKTLVMNVAKYGHQCFNFAAGDEDKLTTLHIANNSGQSSSLLELGTHAKNHPDVKYTHDVEVPMVRLDGFFHDSGDMLDNYLNGADYLSMDIQGFELHALKGMGKLLHKFKWLYLEVNKEQVYKGNGLVGEIDKYVRGFGFYPTTEKYTAAFWGDKLYTKR